MKKYNCPQCNKVFSYKCYKKYCSDKCQKIGYNICCRNYYHSHKKQHNKRVMSWQKRNKDKVKIIMKRYYLKPENRKKAGIRAKKRLQKLRLKALVYYGGNPPKCKCCNEQNTEFLAIDHINGGGNKHRKEIRTNMWNWLKRNNYPKGFQVFCHNCNQSIAFYGYCPHQKLT